VRALGSGLPLAIALAALALSAATRASEPKPAIVEIVELRHTEEALRETYAPKKKMMLPRMVMLDSHGRLIYGGVGLPSDLRRRLTVALEKDQPIDSPINLEAILAETTRSDGSKLTADALPKADAYVVDYWAQWCAPCRMMSRDLKGILNRWDDKRVVWLKIESDPEKLPDRGKQ